MFRCSHTTIRERINSCLLKLRLLKQSIKIYGCVVNTVVVWLHILGPYWCMCVVLLDLLPNRATHIHQQGPNIRRHTTTVLTTQRYILMDYFNNRSFSKHELMRSLMIRNCTEICRSCFNVNFDVNFNIIFKTTQWCISWWINKTVVMFCIQVVIDLKPQNYLVTTMRNANMWNLVVYLLPSLRGSSVAMQRWTTCAEFAFKIIKYVCPYTIYDAQWSMKQ
jgi:hypothetical protein